MAQQKLRKISTFGSQLTSVVSVALVLLVLGIIATGGITARRISHSIKESMGLVAEVKQDTSSDEVVRLQSGLKAKPFTASVSYKPADEILKEEAAQFGDDILTMLDGANPYNSELEIKVREDYASSDSLSVIAAMLEKDPAVARVNLHTGIIDNINASLRKITLVLAAVALVLLIISFVLINNTVSLSIYSRRFLIHTMRLVGAKASFIRRPFVKAGILNGFLAALLACALLAGAYIYIEGNAPVIDDLLGWGTLSVVMCGIIILGILLCALASSLAATRFLRLGYDKLFK